MFANDDAVDVARNLLSLRRARSRLLPGEIFSEPAWDILLIAFIANASGAPITGYKIVEQSDISPRVVSRWIAHLCKIGLFASASIGDLGDELFLSKSARGRLSELLANHEARTVSPRTG